MLLDSLANWDPMGEVRRKSQQEGSEGGCEGASRVTQEMPTSTQGAQLTAFFIMIVTGVDSALENALKLSSAALHTCH